MLGSSHVIGIDVDEDALQTAQENCAQYEDLQVSAMAVHFGFPPHSTSCHTLLLTKTPSHRLYDTAS